MPGLSQPLSDLGIHTLPDWLHTAAFSLLIPGLMAGFAILQGSRSVAAEEESGRLSLLLSASLSRRRLVFGHLAALLLSVLAMALVVTLSLAAFSALGGSPLRLPVLAGTGLNLALFAAALGAFAQALGCLLGRSSMARGLALLALLFGWLLFHLPDVMSLPVWLADFSPWYFYLHARPVMQPAAGSALLVQAGAFLLWSAAAWLIFERRDLSI